MVYRVLCLFHTANKQVEKDEKKGKKQNPSRPVDSFLVRNRNEDKVVEIEGEGLLTSSLYAFGVEHLNNECIEQALSGQFPKGRCEIIGITNIHSTIVSERTTTRIAIAAVQVADQVFRLSLPNSSRYIWLTFDEATKEFFDKKLHDLVYQAMKNLVDFKAQIMRLNEIFVDAVFPNNVMCYPQFCAFFQKYKMRSGNDMRALFRAMNIYNDRGVSFHEFVLGLAAFQPTSRHGGTIGEFRCRLIFRYFAAGCDEEGGAMKREEMQNLFNEIENRLHTQPNTPAEVSALLDACPLTLHTFLQHLGQLKIHGTSNVLRMHLPLAPDLERDTRPRLLLEPIDVGTLVREQVRTLVSEQALTSPPKPPLTDPVELGFVRTSTLPRAKSARKVSGRKPLPPATTPPTQPPANIPPRIIEPELSINPYLLRATPSLTCVNELITKENAKFMSEDSQLEMSQNAIGQRKNHLIYHHADPRMIDDAFGLMQSITYFCRSAPNKKPFSWGPNPTRMNAVWQQFSQTAKNAAAVVYNDPRCLMLDGRVRIFSDLRGKVDDLKVFERVFFPIGCDAINSTFLFMGNNLRGPASFELYSYLLALKVLFPHKVFLVRGGDEVRVKLMDEPFSSEINQKFSEAHMPEAVSVLTRVFDNMPLCAVVNKKMFCSNSGIPHPHALKDGNFFEKIACQPKVLSDQLEPRTLAHQLLYNDFFTYASNEALTFDEMSFAFSKSRQCYFYTDEAVNKFLTTIGCTHFVRGNRLSPHGIDMQCSGRLISIHSSSQTGNIKNEASCIIVNDNKVRIFTVGRNARERKEKTVGQ
ncbi:unnamed protein product, partial [Mesorhabditis spiculigera]